MKPWRALGATLLALAWGAAAAQGGGPDADEGRALYVGRHPALAASTLRGASQAPVPAAQAACVACHRPSGLGSFEGEAVVPPIGSGLLSSPYDPATTRRYGPTGGRAGAAALRVRPAYDAAALHRLLTQGRTPDDRDLGPLMPQYRLSAAQSAALLAYLNRLGTEPTPGVEDEVVHFATITSAEVPEAQSQELVGLLRRFFARKNAQTRAEPQRRASALRNEHTMYSRYRRWELHHWVLSGEPETWPAQLRALYARQPVFAVVSGRSTRDWSPVHAFCEAERLPCLFPITAWPPEQTGFYSTYFSGGAPAQARWLAAEAALPKQAEAASVPWLVLAGDDPGAARQAQRVAAALQGMGGVAGRGARVDTRWRGEPVVVSALAPQEVSRRLAAGPAAAAVSVFLLAGEAPPAARSLQPAWPPGAQVHWVTQQHATSGLLARGRVWWRSQGLKPQDEAQAAQVFFAATAAVESLVHVDERFSREYCIEKLEHNLENMPPMTGYPRLSLAPNQRLAAKQVWMVPAN